MEPLSLESQRHRLGSAAYDAVRLLINGLFPHLPNRLSVRNPEHVREVRENSVVLVFRLLFLLHAEGRGLLPLEREPYRRLSLTALHEQINMSLRMRQPYAANRAGLWKRLGKTFRIMAEGLREADTLVVPANPLPLFQNARYPRIAQEPVLETPRWEIPDAFLAEAIDRLAYPRSRPDLAGVQAFDHAGLGTYCLSELCAQMLALNAHVAELPMVEIVSDGRVVFWPQKLAPRRAPVHGFPPREVAKGQVYLVRPERPSPHEPEPLLERIAATVVGTRLETAGYQRESTRLFDPAMGCGGFLLKAATALGTALGVTPRTVVERHLAGADLDPLAAEAGRMCLWLHAATVDDPPGSLESQFMAGNAPSGAKGPELEGLEESPVKGTCESLAS